LKKIECFVQPTKLDALKKALIACGVEGLSVTEVRGFGRQAGQTGPVKKEEAKLLPKLKLEIVVPEEMVESVLKTVKAAAGTGKIGSGKIFILPVEEALRIRTGEVGLSAID